MPKKLVNSFMANRIYYADILKDGTMGSRRVDLTDEAIIAVMTHMSTMHERGGKAGFKVKGLGEIYFTPWPKDSESNE